MTYIQNYQKDEENCVFCTVVASPDGPENLIVYRGSQNYVILNRYPYTSGHLMVVPFLHRANLEELDAATRSNMMELANQAIQVLQTAYAPQGFNLGVNIGEVAGAGIMSHVHMHVVPRWGGDTNFMSTLSSTRVLPENLEVTYQRIYTAWMGK